MAPSPRVRCGACAFEWFGATASHGLRIVGSCPRCGGGLEFLVPDEDDRSALARMDASIGVRRPSAVLGAPARR